MSRAKLSRQVRVNPAKPPIDFDIKKWLAEPGMLVTRRELWEFTNRLEVGRRMRNRWPSRMRRAWRGLVAWLLRRDADAEDKIYR